MVGNCQGLGRGGKVSLTLGIKGTSNIGENFITYIEIHIKAKSRYVNMLTTLNSWSLENFVLYAYLHF